MRRLGAFQHRRLELGVAHKPEELLMKKKGEPTRKSVVVPPVETARAIFWQTVKEIVPEVFEDLEATPVSELPAWAKRWNLDEDWCTEFGESVITRLEVQRRRYGEATVFSAVDGIADVDLIQLFESDVLAREKDAALRSIHNSLNKAIYKDPIWKNRAEPLVDTTTIEVAIESMLETAGELLDRIFPLNGFPRYSQVERNIRFLVCRRIKRPRMSYREIAKNEIASWGEKQQGDVTANRIAKAYKRREQLNESQAAEMEIDRIRKGIKSARTLLRFE